MEAYEDMIRHTATPYAPWYVIPADNKWFTRLVVAAAVIHALSSLGLHFCIDPSQKADILYLFTRKRCNGCPGSSQNMDIMFIGIVLILAAISFIFIVLCDKL